MDRIALYIQRFQESQSYKRLRKFLSRESHVVAVGLWAAAFLTGIVSVLYALFFRSTEHFFQSFAHKPIVFIVSPLCFLAAWLLIKIFSPEAGGSGIPQVMAANEQHYSDEGVRFVDRLLSIKTGLIKMLSSILCILGGGAIGREGPTLQIGACIFHNFGRIVRIKYPNISEHTWIIAGAASGLASAFNTPLGGIVYAIEEMGSSHFQKVKTALLSAVIISGLVSQWVIGNYLYLGLPKLQGFGNQVLFIVALISVICGLSGAYFGKALCWAVMKRRQITHKWGLTVIAAGCGLLIAAASYFLPQASGTGIDLTMSYLFHNESADVTTVFLRFLSPIITYASGTSGGIFAPALSAGAVIGSYVSEMFSNPHNNLMVLVGMIGFLTGVTRTPFTSFILVQEMTDRHSAIFPMMFAAIVSYVVSQMIDKESFYEKAKKLWLHQ